MMLETQGTYLRHIIYKQGKRIFEEFRSSKTHE